MELPRLAFTMGDAAGIGPELIVGVCRDQELYQHARPVVIGHHGIIKRAVSRFGKQQTVVEVKSPDEMDPTPEKILCIHCGHDDVLEVPPATVDRRCGSLAYSCLEKATELVQAGSVDAIVTAPLNKQSLNLAGFTFPGHTEALASLLGYKEASMMLYLPPRENHTHELGLGVVHVTLHMALSEVIQSITHEKIVSRISEIDWIMRRLMFPSKSGTCSVPVQSLQKPRIGVAALNPHAGEGGVFGDEEERVIVPAVREASHSGIEVVGPLPADSLMSRADSGEFDGVVAMYHDQGHVALKLLGFHESVNVTLGLPIVRTSPTYGTAFDIAWRGAARVDGMMNAAKVASVLARSRE